MDVTEVLWFIVHVGRKSDAGKKWSYCPLKLDAILLGLKSLGGPETGTLYPCKSFLRSWNKVTKSTQWIWNSRKVKFLQHVSAKSWRHRGFHSQNLTVDLGERSASHSDRFYPRGSTSITRRIGCWMNPRYILDLPEQNLSLELNTRSLVCRIRKFMTVLTTARHWMLSGLADENKHSCSCRESYTVFPAVTSHFPERIISKEPKEWIP